MGIPIDPIPDALTIQELSCAALGSPTYATILRGVRDDYLSGGITASLMQGRFDRPVHDAAALRLLAGLHEIVLRGHAPELASHFPTSGGTPGPSLAAVALETIESHRGNIDIALARQVQTNEVGRSIVLMVLSHWLPSIGVREFDLIEVGASAGLNLNFDRYGAHTGTLTMGDADSDLFFGREWFGTEPVVGEFSARVANRVGIDPFPIDATTDEGALRLRSFVWPDDHDRRVRLDAALQIARRHPPRLVQASADTFLDGESRRPLARPTMVFHSIAWQYMGRTVQSGVRDSLSAWARSSSKQTPLVWARMEPAGSVADVRATVWTGSEPHEHVLAEVGFHGRNMRWLGSDPEGSRS